MFTDGDVNPAASTASDEKSAAADTCTWYDVAAVTAFHVSAGVSGISIAPGLGDTSVGTVGGPAVVNIHTTDQLLVSPRPFAAFTRQKWVVPVASGVPMFIDADVV